MKKIISFVLLAAMLVSLIVPASLAADEVASVAADSVTILDDGNTKSLTAPVKLVSNPGQFEALEFVIFWKTSAGVTTATFEVNGEVCDTDLSGASKPGDVSDAIAGVVDDPSEYKGITVTLYANTAVDGEQLLGNVKFNYRKAVAAGTALDFSVVTTAFNEATDKISSEKTDATITLKKDENLGKYTEPTLFAVTETPTITPNTSTIKVDVRVDANPGFYGGQYFLVYPSNWSLVVLGQNSEGYIYEAYCGNVFPAKESTVGGQEYLLTDMVDEYNNLKFAIQSFPETPVEGTKYINTYFECTDKDEVNSKNGILYSYVFNVPADMKIGDTADFLIIYDKDGEFSKPDPENPSEGIAVVFDSVKLTVTMDCQHTSTHEELVKDADCGNDGSKNVVCDDCGKVMDTIVLPATGNHDYKDVRVEPTCTEDGSEHKECSVCHQTTAVTVIDKLGHDDQFVETVAATCTAGGYDLYECTRCHVQTRKNETAPVPHTPGTPVVVAATCTEDGSSVVTCTVCETVLENTVLNALGHDWDEGVVTAPTCEERGYTTKTCQRCNEVEVIDYVDALGHKMTETSRTEPTCTEDGEVVYTCANGCGKVETVVLDKLGHAYDNGVVTTEPTCTEKGVKTFTCTREGCGVSYTEEIAALGHAWDEGKVTTEPTCTEKGVKTFTCTREGCAETKTEEIAALGHAWDEGKVTTEPTCTEKGVKTFTCTREGCTETKTEEIAALGHTWDEGKVTKPATEKETGLKVYTCTVCGETKEETIPVIVPEQKPATDDKELSLDGVEMVDGTWNIPVSMKKDYLTAGKLSFTMTFDTNKSTFKGINGLKPGTYDVVEKNGTVVVTIKDLAQLKNVKEGAQIFSLQLTPKDVNSTKADLGLKLVDSVETVKSPTTGDNMMYIVIALAVVVLSATAVVVIRRRKENN